MNPGPRWAAHPTQQAPLVGVEDGGPDTRPHPDPHGPRRCSRVSVERPGRQPLTAPFGGLPLRRRAQRGPHRPQARSHPPSATKLIPGSAEDDARCVTHRRGCRSPRRPSWRISPPQDGRSRHGRSAWRNAAQDPRGLRRLPRRHPSPATRRDNHGVVTGELDDRNGAPLHSALDPPSGDRGSGGGDLGATRLTWTRKREGTTAWRESVEYRGGVEGAAAQGPRDMAKAGLLEAQSPAMQTSHPGHDVCSHSHRHQTSPTFLVPTLPAGGQRATSLFKGTDGTPTSRSIRPRKGNAGSPTGREPYGDGVSVVVAGVTTCQGRRESRRQGEGTQVLGSTTTVRYARCGTPQPY